VLCAKRLGARWGALPGLCLLVCCGAA
jgi:hypothetical protein